MLDETHLDLTTKFGQGFVAFLSALATDERERIVRRDKDRRQLVRKTGTKIGRKLRLNATQQTRTRDVFNPFKRSAFDAASGLPKLGSSLPPAASVRVTIVNVVSQLDGLTQVKIDFVSLR